MVAGIGVVGTSLVWRICWEQEGPEVSWDQLLTLQFLASCLTSLHLKHCPSLMHFVRSCGVSFFNFTKLTSMASVSQGDLEVEEDCGQKLLYHPPLWSLSIQSL